LVAAPGGGQDSAGDRRFDHPIENRFLQRPATIEIAAIEVYEADGSVVHQAANAENWHIPCSAIAFVTRSALYD
jgi:hypothetical protein